MTERARVVPPIGVTTIDASDDARALAGHLLAPGRTWPVVVVSTPAHSAGPYVDVQELKAEVGNLAEVVLVRTGDPSWAFSAEMPPQTQVYGGASRVYPVGLDWVGDPYRSRLRFAFSAAAGAEVREQLVHDALGAALSAGLVGSASASTTTRSPSTTGTVRGVVGARALVDLDDGGQATIAEELTGARVPLDQVLRAGMRVEGVLDDATRLLDVAASVPDLAASRRLVEAAYQPGAVVLVRVREADRDSVTVELAPQLPRIVGRDLVTTNDLDRLDDLVEPGEVLLARFGTGADGGPNVRLDDIDETEETPVDALALLPGGPPWLRLPEPPDVAPRAATQGESITSDGAEVPTTGAPPDVAVLPQTAPVPVVPVVPMTPPRPTPALLSRRTASAPPPEPLPESDETGPPSSASPPSVRPSSAASTALRDTQLALAEARARLTTAETEATTSSTLAQQLTTENAQLLTEVRHLTVELEQLERRHADLKSKYRKSDLRRQRIEGQVTTPDASTWFTEPDDQLRHEVLEAWVRTVPTTEKGTWPLRDYVIGPKFLGSLSLDGISRRKIVETVVHVVTGRAADLNGLQLHPLRTSDSGSAPQVVRDDGAACWRVSLQVNSPSARRLHFWRLPDGGVELSRVVLHDDVEP